MIISLCAIALSTVGQVTQLGPRCSAPPVGASEACVTCYDKACEQWISDFYECDGKRECVNNAIRQYNLRLMNCVCRPVVAEVLATVNQVQMVDTLIVLDAVFKGSNGQ